MKGNLFYNLRFLFLAALDCRAVEYAHILFHSAPQPSKQQSRILYKSNLNINLNVCLSLFIPLNILNL